VLFLLLILNSQLQHMSTWSDVMNADAVLKAKSQLDCGECHQAAETTRQLLLGLVNLITTLQSYLHQVPVKHTPNQARLITLILE
jgi:hypothetical protein